MGTHKIKGPSLWSYGSWIYS